MSTPIPAFVALAAALSLVLTMQVAAQDEPTPAEEPTEEDADDEIIRLENPIPDPDAKPEKPKKEKRAERQSAPLTGPVLMAEARKILKKKGCIAAAPTYRVAAAMGAGFEPAQHELGDCLLNTPGATPAEDALLKQEAFFWLNRAAHAGNARAQRLLAVQYASPNGVRHDSTAALQWALVFNTNPEKSLYSQPLPPTMVSGLRAGLSDAAIAQAETFAASFTPLQLEAFTPPKQKKGRKEAVREELPQRRERRRSDAQK